MIKVKRVYEDLKEDDGFRILVDRVWPRGIKKDVAKISLWSKDIAPTPSLRKWFSHEPKKWDEFKRRYFEELKEKNELVNAIIDQSRLGTVTLLYGTKEETYNNAVALKEYLDSKITGTDKEEKIEKEGVEEKTEKEEEVEKRPIETEEIEEKEEVEKRPIETEEIEDEKIENDEDI